MRDRKLKFALPLLAAFAACGGKAPPAPDGVEAVAAHAGKLATRGGGPGGAHAPLQPGQSIQGTILADLGGGEQAFRSLSTRVADDVGQQLERRLGGAEGQRALEQANRALASAGAGAVDGEDVRRIVGGMAGKTFHQASVLRVDIVRSLRVHMQGKAADGAELELGLEFDAASLELAGTRLGYRPAGAGVFDQYGTTEEGSPEVVVERFERKADGSWSIAGTFSARDVPPAVTSKHLKGSLARASGRFDYNGLPEKAL